MPFTLHIMAFVALLLFLSVAKDGVKHGQPGFTVLGLVSALVGAGLWIFMAATWN